MTTMCILGAFFEFVDELPDTNLFSLRMYVYDYIYDMDICMYVETYYLTMKKILVELFHFLLDL